MTERDGNGGVTSIVLPDAWTGCITFPWVAGSFSREQGFQNSELSKEMYFVSGTNCNGYTQNVYDIQFVSQGPNTIGGSDGKGSQSVEFYTPSRRMLRRRSYNDGESNKTISLGGLSLTGCGGLGSNQTETSIEERQAGPLGVDAVYNGHQFLAPINVGTGWWAIGNVQYGNDAGAPNLGAQWQFNEVAQSIGAAFGAQVTSGTVDVGAYDIKFFIGPFVNGFEWEDVTPSIARLVSFRAMHWGADQGRSWTSFRISDYKGRVIVSIVIWAVLIG